MVSSETRLNARTIIVTNSALVTILFGANKPSPTPVTLPVSSTVAIDVLALVHVIVLSSVVSLGVIVVDIVVLDFLKIVFDASGVVKSVIGTTTVTFTLSDLPLAVAVIFALPAATAVTTPLLSTVAIDSSIATLVIFSCPFFTA